MPVENLRWSRLGLALTPELNPFVCAIVDSRSSGTSGYEGSSIDQYYTRWQPASVAELLGLSVDSSPELRQPAAAVGLPWMAETENVDPANRLAVVDRWAREESLRHGRQLDSSHGHKLFGPASGELGRLEYQRYCDLAASIAVNGYEESLSEPIGVQLLIDDCNWVGLSTGPGLHRLAALAALGVDPVPVAIDKRPALVHRSDVDAWPGVRSGLYHPREALRLFDRIMAGEPPAGMPTFAPKGGPGLGLR